MNNSPSLSFKIINLVLKKIRYNQWVMEIIGLNNIPKKIPTKDHLKNHSFLSSQSPKIVKWSVFQFYIIQTIFTMFIHEHKAIKYVNTQKHENYGLAD